MLNTCEAKNVVRISKVTVDAAKPEGGDHPKRYAVWDKELKGFGLFVFPSGVKSYVARYRVGGGRRGVLRQIVIGRHGTLTPEKAREWAKIALGQAADGKDPQGAKAARRAEMTMSELCDLYLKDGVSSKKQSTVALDRIRIARHIKPTIGRIRISEIGRADIERLMRDVISGKIRDEATPHTRGGKGAAARTVGLLGGMFSFAVDRRLLKENPTVGVKRPMDTRRERFLSPGELARLSEVIAELADSNRGPNRTEGGIVTEQHRRILQLLLLTGARKNEIVRLRWKEVDSQTGFLRLGDSKTGARSIALGAAAAVVLAEVDQTGSEWVFPDPKDPAQPVRNVDWAWVCIRNRAGLSDVRIHDLRHTFASVALMGGNGLAFIGKLLGHKHAQTTARYAHLSDDPVKAAADRISEAMSAQMKGLAGNLRELGGAKGAA